MIKRTQVATVLSHLKRKGSITSLEAIQYYGITRISAVIFKLKKMGVFINSTPCPHNIPFHVYSLDLVAYKEYKRKQTLTAAIGMLASVRDKPTTSGKVTHAGNVVNHYLFSQMSLLEEN
jgi:hypothetical protein